MLRIIILINLILSSLSGNDSDGYRFFCNDYLSQEKVSMEMDVLTEFQTGAFSFQGTFSGLINTSIVDHNLPGGRVKVIQEWSNVIGLNKRNDEVKPNHDATRLNGTQFIVIIDSTGKTESIEGNNDTAREMIDESQSFSSIFGSENYFYPFGPDSLRKVGDVWSYSSEKDLGAQVGSDGYSGHQQVTTTVTFKKIKVKKGKQIAILKMKQIISENGTTVTWDDTYDVKMEGEFVGTAQFNITDGFVKLYKTSGSLKGLRTNLSNDHVWNYVQNFDLKMKRKK